MPFLIIDPFRQYLLRAWGLIRKQKYFYVLSRPGQVVQLVGVSSCTPKVCGFGPVGAHTGGNQSMFLSQIDVSLFLSQHIL